MVGLISFALGYLIGLFFYSVSKREAQVYRECLEKYEELLDDERNRRYEADQKCIELLSRNKL